ncbi:MAG: hypothetical protein H0U75_06815 [Legionella sp.]|nr:hypothetical protein [Legionella sp.]
MKKLIIGLLASYIGVTFAISATNTEDFKVATYRPGTAGAGLHNPTTNTSSPGNGVSGSDVTSPTGPQGGNHPVTTTGGGAIGN